MDWSNAARGRRYAPENSDGSSYVNYSTSRRSGPLSTAFSSPQEQQTHIQAKPPQNRRSLNHLLHGDDIMTNTMRRPPSSSHASPLDAHNSTTIATAQEDRMDSKTKEDENLLYHLIHFSDPWFALTIFLHVLVFSLLISMSRRHLSSGTTSAFSLLAVFTVVLLFTGRWNLKKTKKGRTDIDLGILTPEDEADEVPAVAINLFAAAAILEGVALAIFASVTAGGFSDEQSGDIYFSHDAVLQVLRFASIILLSFHRIIRPANRADPLRSMLELEVVSVCWDAIDGSTFYALLGDPGSNLNSIADNSARVLMAFWYLSVGVRLSMMFLVHHKPSNSGIPTSVLKNPLEMSSDPTVDRTMQALRVRASIIMMMALSEIFAIGLRLALWCTVGLSTVQQEMTIKNFLFSASVVNAYIMWQYADLRDWNRNEFFGWHIPSREVQLEICKWSFVVSYVALGALMSSFLIEVTNEGTKWTANVGTDIILAFGFAYYYKNCYIRRDQQDTKSWSFDFRRLSGYVIFPGTGASILGGLLSINLVCARIPALYRHATEMEIDENDSALSYNNAMLLVQLTMIPIFCYAMYWSLALMLFRKEFTASPGNYNAIHDPMIGLVGTSVMIEGALDVVSAAAFMALGTSGLPNFMNDLVVACALLEIWNACQSFALQALLSGGFDDTPLDLVTWKARLRMFRVPIDAGTFVLRCILWAEYKQASVSIFLVKNLYNLFHTLALIERARGAAKYPKGTLFTEFVNPKDWYGLSAEEWRDATSQQVTNKRVSYIGRASMNVNSDAIGGE